MTMGPAPMIRIDFMSVRLGIVEVSDPRSRHKKRRRRTLASTPWSRREASATAARPLAQNRRGGKGGAAPFPGRGREVIPGGGGAVLYRAPAGREAAAG